MGKTALVTGGSHNIGQGIAIVLAEHGWDVAITYRNRKDGAEETRKAIEALGRKCYVFQASLEQADGPQKAVDAAYDALGHLDLCVCNAGRDTRGSILTATAEELAMIFENNYRNYILTAGAAARYMVRDGIKGSIIFITSSRAEQAYPEDFLYGGFKGAIKRACESIALDLSAYGIRVNCVAPGAVWPHASEDPEKETNEFLRKSIPLHRSGTPRDMGEAVAYMAEKATYATGITLRLDGGLILPGLVEGGEPDIWYRPQWREDVTKKAMEMLEAHEKERKA